MELLEKSDRIDSADHLEETNKEHHAISFKMSPREGGAGGGSSGDDPHWHRHKISTLSLRSKKEIRRDPSVDFHEAKQAGK
jgi:hypothetical protein